MTNAVSPHSAVGDPPTEAGQNKRPGCDELDRTGQRVRVLVVEDSTIVRERVVAMVSDLPNVIVVAEAKDGPEAQRHFQTYQPDVVVLDIQLPGISGLDLLPRFKRENPSCLVIVLTSYASKTLRRQCSALGADHFFEKCTEFVRVTEVLAAFKPGAAKMGAA